MMPTGTIHEAPRIPRRVGAALAGCALAAMLGACGAAQPTEELIDARRAYGEAQDSEASEHSPDRLLAARQALERAESAHGDEPRSDRERALAYIAKRRAQLAMAYGRIGAAIAAQKQARQAYESALEDTAERATSRAQETQEKLERRERELEEKQRALEEERAARVRAEEKAAAALQSLEEIGNVKEEARGMVITLSGAVLFKTGEASLLPIARRQLDKVAAALMEQREDKTITVEGHTDSRGSHEANQTLSEKRAMAVRDHLVNKGLSPDRLRAVGKGEDEPVASNQTSDGRANNRRVEIVVGGGDG